MAGIAFNTTELVTTVKDRGLIPTTQALFDTAAFLRACTQEMWGEILCDLMRVRNQYLIGVEDQALVGNRSNYRMPNRAVGGKLEHVAILSGGKERQLDQITPQELQYLTAQSTASDVGDPVKFYVENHEVVLWPTPGSTASGLSLRQKYAMRPNKLIPVTEAFQVASTSVVGSDTRLVGGTVPATFAIGTKCDVIAGKPGFQTLAMNITATDYITGAGGYVAFATSDIPTGSKAITTPSIDWVCLAEESPVPQIPVELHAVLAVFGLAAHLEAMGDFQAADRARKIGLTRQEKALVLLNPRVNGQVKKAVNRNWFRGRRSW